MQKKMLILAAEDNVGVLRENAEAGDTAVYGDKQVTCTENIPFCHKVALRDIARHEDFIKYGEIIGYALRDIKKGEWIHTHNLDDIRGRESKL